MNDIHTLDELRQFIHQTLCEKENLLADQFTMTEVRLTRGNVVCGLQFCMGGPRNVRLAAIWVADRNIVYLYDARGARYAKLRIRPRPFTPRAPRDIKSVAAQATEHKDACNVAELMTRMTVISDQPSIDVVQECAKVAGAESGRDSQRPIVGECFDNALSGDGRKGI